jgi:hypothetical protein
MKKKTDDTELKQYAQFGMAAMLPGMIHAREILDRRIREMQEQLAGLQDGKKQDGRRNNKGGAAAYWAKLTPEERSAEMKRRGMTHAQASKVANARWAKVRKNDTVLKKTGNSWEKFRTPAARAAEMKRRMALRRKPARLEVAS